MNSTTATAVTPRRFEPNVRFAWGQMIVMAVIGSVVIAITDCFKFPRERSLTRFGCVGAGMFVGILVLFWFRSARTGDCR